MKLLRSIGREILCILVAAAVDGYIGFRFGQALYKDGITRLTSYYSVGFIAVLACFMTFSLTVMLFYAEIYLFSAYKKRQAELRRIRSARIERKYADAKKREQLLLEEIRSILDEDATTATTSHNKVYEEEV